jgi:hypothetical protein
MREGRDLNQHGQAGRQEQASSSSPLIFQEILPAASAARLEMPDAPMTQAIATETMDLLHMILFISFFLLVETLPFPQVNLITRKEWSMTKMSVPMMFMPIIGRRSGRTTTGKMATISARIR